MIPTSDHNESLVGDTLYQISLNFEWRKLVTDIVYRGLNQFAADIEDETDRATFENRIAALIEDFYDEDIGDMPGTLGGAKIHRSTNQNNGVTTNVWWAVSFDTEIEDTDDYVNIASQATRITIPNDGLYAIGASVIWESNSSADSLIRAMRVIQTSADNLTTNVLALDRNNIVSQQIPLHVFTKSNLVAGDYIRLQMFTAIPNLNIISVGQYAPLLWVERWR